MDLHPRLASRMLFFFVLVACSFHHSFCVGQGKVDEQLQEQLQPLLNAHKGDVGLAIRNLRSGEHYEFQSDVPMPTASLIKLPIMVTCYRQIDAEKLSPATMLSLDEADKVPGSGILTDHFSSGVQLPLHDFVHLMIRYSDNTATNVVIDQIGLPETSATMKELGFANTQLHSKVFRGDTSIAPDRSKQFGLGSTTAAEMVELLSRFEAGELASESATQAMRAHLLDCDDDTKLAAKIPATVEFAHKTGAISNCRTDAGIMYTDGGPVAVCLLTNRNEDQSWTDDNAAHRLAANIGEIVVERFGAKESSDSLRQGSYGTLVEALQRTLNARMTPSPGLAVDGDFGPATRRAVEQFQRDKGLPVTGQTDRSTWDALGTVLYDESPVEDPATINSQSLPLQPRLADTAAPLVTAKAWVIADAESGAVQYSENGNQPLPPASTTKIMTAYLVLTYAEQFPEVLDEVITFSQRADRTRGSTSGLRAGEEVTVRELLYGLLLPSGNDASVAFAETLGSRILDHLKARSDAQDTLDGQTASAEGVARDSYADFIAAMNLASEGLGMKHTHFDNPHGLTVDSHLVSAADLARLTAQALRIPLFQDVVATRQRGVTVTGADGYRRNVKWTNTNRLLGIEGFAGVKTGTTQAAGACLVGLAEYDGQRLIGVVLGSGSSSGRYADIRNLFRWASAQSQ